MIRASHLISRSIWNGRRLAAARLMHRSVLRAIRATCRCGTRHRRRHAGAERKHQGDEDYSEKAHLVTLLLPSGAGNDSGDPWWRPAPCGFPRWRAMSWRTRFSG